MNDFTKDELMNISDAILYSSLFHSRQDRLIPIRDKIQSLIDNYCDHELIPNGSGNYICSKCPMYGELNE